MTADNIATDILPGDLDAAIAFIERLKNAPANVFYNILAPQLRREGPGTALKRELEKAHAPLKVVLTTRLHARDPARRGGREVSAHRTRRRSYVTP